MSELAGLVQRWYVGNARDLPWRRPGTSAWGVLVSEVMLQQTPVSRALPVYERWMQRWPTANDLAAAPLGDVLREWGRLGYPRRAIRLHECAVTLVRDHAGVMPRELPQLLALPGVGDYTARAVASFAFGQRHAVVDTNVRRVVARATAGTADAAPGSPARDLRAVEPLVPVDPAEAARFSAAVMELGALVCTARAPRCDACPLAASCAWRAAGRPPYDGPQRRTQAWAGTDRQARGELMRVVREAAGPVDRALLTAAWPPAEQRSRALTGLAADGLLELNTDGSAQLPGGPQLA